MKKVFAILAMAAVVAVACSKDDGTGKKKKDKDEGETTYVAPITIDGDFSDWAKLDANKVSTATCAADALKTALKTVKVYADETYVFIYFEFDKDQITWKQDVEHVPFHLYINGDGDASTGGFGDQFSDACVDLLCEGFLTDGNDFASYDPGAFKWNGEANGTGWSWEGVLDEGAGLCSGAGKGNAYEIRLTREMYPLEGGLADNFSIGFDIQQSWSSVGILPNANVTDDNVNGLAPMLAVKTVK